MKYCPNCGATLEKIKPSGREIPPAFCPECGLDLNSPTSGPLSPGELENHVIELLKQRKFVDAVTLRKMHGGGSLKESRQFVEEIARRNGLQDSLDVPLTARLVSLFFLSLFLGLFISLAGIAVFPKTGLIAKPFLCKGTLRLESLEISGQMANGTEVKEVTKSFYCGNGEDVTRSVKAVSIASYTGIVFVLLVLVSLLRRSSRRKRQGPIS